MAAVSLCEASLADLKNRLRDEFHEVKSAHVSEALAYSMGFNTHAALRATLAAQAEPKPPFILLDSERFRQRLVQLGYYDDPEFHFELSIIPPIPGVMTTQDGMFKGPFTLVRERAWRNLMVLAINAALEQRVMTLHAPNDGAPRRVPPRGTLFDFALPNGLPGRGYVQDAGWGELAISAAINPRGNKVQYLMADFSAGDVYGYSWLERRTGLWLQDRSHTLRCRKHLVDELASLEVKPLGYGDRGPFIL